MKGIVPPSMAMPTHARAKDAWQSLLGALSQGRGVRGGLSRSSRLLNSAELLKKLGRTPVITLPASQQRPETRIRVSRG